MVALLAWPTDVEPSAYQGDEPAVDFGEAGTEDGGPWAVSGSAVPETGRG